MRILKPLPGILPMPGHPLADAIGFWPMSSLGNKVFDLSGYNANGIFDIGTASPIWVPGKFGPATYYDGGDQIKIGEPAHLDVSFSNLTLSVWFRITDEGGVRGIFGKGLIWYLRTNGITAVSLRHLNIGDGETRITVPNLSNIWHHLVGTIGPGGTKLYLDGIYVGGEANVGSTGVNNSGLVIGNWEEDGGGGLDWIGDIDLPMIWNRTLNPSEIALLCWNPFCMFPETIMAEFGIAA